MICFVLFCFRLTAVSESFSQQQINGSEMSLWCSPIPLLRLQQQDRDWVVPSRLAMLKYVHALPCTTQCDSVKEQSRACAAGIFFIYDQQSSWTWPPDKDAVCGMMLVWCPPAWPVGGIKVWGSIFIHSLPQFILVNTGVSQAVLTPSVSADDRWGWRRFPGLKLHNVDTRPWCSQEPSVKPRGDSIFVPKDRLLTCMWDTTFNNTNTARKNICLCLILRAFRFYLVSDCHSNVIISVCVWNKKLSVR